MSNFLAVATVTATLHNRLLDAAAVVPGATVATRRPDGAPPAGPSINAFLYQVMPNAAYRNADLPTRRADGQPVRRPCAALVLHYLLSFVGEENKLEPQRLLGAVIRQLHAEPALRPADIASTITNAPFDTILGASDLGDQVDSVRFVPLNLSLDELSKVWSVFFQTPYSLSVAYEASAVLIEAEDVPRLALPVKAREVYGVPFQQPHLVQVISEKGENAPISATSTLVLKGSQLRGARTLVLLAGQARPVATVSSSAITLPVPAGLQAGIHGLQVIHEIDMAGVFHRGVESNVASFVLQPAIKGAIGKTTMPNPAGGPAIRALRVRLDVKVGATQRVVLILNNTASATPAAFSFLSSERPADSDTLVIAIPDVVAGQYFVRVQVDGASTPISLDTSSPQFGPVVTLP
jgi:hypothetical protein